MGRSVDDPIFEMSFGSSLGIAFDVLDVPPVRDEELITPRMIEQRPDDVGAQIAWHLDGSYPDAARLVNLGGEKATILRVSRRGAEDMEIANTFVFHGGSFFWARFIVCPTPWDDKPYRRFEPEMETILATWRWSDVNYG